MKRIFPAFTYGEGPRQGCWWDETCAIPARPTISEPASADVVVIGGGFTGLSAALHLARKGARVHVFEAKRIGWGASGRNGGFCCLGGAKADDRFLDRKFGKSGRLEWRAAEKAAVDLVGSILTAEKISADRHSRGETALAHRPRDMKSLEAGAASVRENYGVEPALFFRADLADQGMSGPFHGAMTIPIGFGLNPAKYLAGLAAAAERAGALIFDSSPVRSIEKAAGGYRLCVGDVRVTANQVVVATNGYSSEDIPGWLTARFLPTQSNVLVTRPLTDKELSDQGWTSDQMSYDTRNLLHYFRLMPDQRFLFGMRGGVFSGPGAEQKARRAVRRDFEQMFPAWAHAESQNSWSGLVSLARSRMPFAGAVPGSPGMWAGLCYHGNGVAMGTLTGSILASLVSGEQPACYPKAMRTPPGKFPLGAARRLLVLPLYAGLRLKDL
ncbi:FAD-binding oxidoreductase [uncultured Roseobacter sp.]|uniref:NAD(P)/FAD-dependent oxidoreductase n=1 Tax=uncultured Roseobacter sp. TaxID=114847 RepID=UPI00261CC085|nr:FAD-binding oxidoreductase [uncultured Roseobacter sp.]